MFADGSTLVRRAALQLLLTPMTLSTIATVAPIAPTAATPPPPYRRARGAAELDAEYYLRSLLGRTAPPDVTPAPPRPPRVLDATAATLLLELVAQQLAEQLKLPLSEVHARAEAQRPQLAVELDRSLLAGAFANVGYDSASVNRREATVQDEYEFDLRLCCLLELFATARPDASAASRFSASLGDRLYAAALPAARRPEPSRVLSGALAGCTAILRYLAEVGYLGGWTLDDSDADDAVWSRADELSTTQLSITLDEPASLRSSLWLNQRSGGRLSAGLAPPLVCAHLRACGAAVEAASGELFLDGTYRDNPNDYRATQTVVQLTVRPSASMGRASF